MSSYASGRPLPVSPQPRVTPLDAGPGPEDVSRGLLWALLAVPPGLAVAVAATSARGGSVTVLAALTLAFLASVLYRRGARVVGRRGVVVVVAVLAVGVALEVVAIVAADVVALGGRGLVPASVTGGVLDRLGDPQALAGYGASGVVLLLVALGGAAVSLAWLRADEGDRYRDG